MLLSENLFTSSNSQTTQEKTKENITQNKTQNSTQNSTITPQLKNNIITNDALYNIKGEVFIKGSPINLISQELEQKQEQENKICL